MNENWAWSSRLVTIFTTYASALLPIALFVIWIRRKNARGDFTPRTAFSRFMESFALGANNYAISIPTKEHLKSTEKSFKSDCFWLLFLSLGVTVPLWLMGLLQERIVTHPYKRLEDPAVEEYFHDMQFLVFSNRLFGFLLSGCLLFVTRRSQPIHVPPYYMHSFTSIANIMASWCQYSALQFVTFPTMTISKVSKVVGTMIMGTVLRGKQYSLSEYITAGGIAFGAGLFLVHTVPNHSQITSTTISGFILIAGYLIFDPFTANWQKALFNTKPKISKGQMMFGVNVFSVLLSVFSLLEQGSFLPAIDFALNHENFVRHNALMSLAAAISQLFIYATIDRFGPVTLSVMMTIRQIGSILLSVVAFGHQIPAIASLGLFITFGCLFLDIYLRYFKNSPHRCLN